MESCISFSSLRFAFFYVFFSTRGLLSFFSIGSSTFFLLPIFSSTRGLVSFFSCFHLSGCFLVFWSFSLDAVTPSFPLPYCFLWTHVLFALCFLTIYIFLIFLNRSPFVSFSSSGAFSFLPCTFLQYFFSFFFPFCFGVFLLLSFHLSYYFIFLFFFFCLFFFQFSQFSSFLVVFSCIFLSLVSIFMCFLFLPFSSIFLFRLSFPVFFFLFCRFSSVFFMFSTLYSYDPIFFELTSPYRHGLVKALSRKFVFFCNYPNVYWLEQLVGERKRVWKHEITASARQKEKQNILVKK